MARALVPLAAAVLGLFGSLTATLFLYQAATASLDRVLEERLRGAGETAAELLARGEPGGEVLRAVMEANRLEGVYVVSPSLRILADAAGPVPARANLLRVDAERVAEAVAGRASVEFAYALGDLRIATGYFPVRGPGRGMHPAVLAVEAGQSFDPGRRACAGRSGRGWRSRCWGALALAVVAGSGRGARSSAAASPSARRGATRWRAWRPWWRTRSATPSASSAGRSSWSRSGPARLGPDDREALADVLGEVERLRRLTEDFLDLAREPPLAELPPRPGRARRRGGRRPRAHPPGSPSRSTSRPSGGGRRRAPAPGAGEPARQRGPGRGAHRRRPRRA